MLKSAIDGEEMFKAKLKKKKEKWREKWRYSRPLECCQGEDKILPRIG